MNESLICDHKTLLAIAETLEELDAPESAAVIREAATRLKDAEIAIRILMVAVPSSVKQAQLIKNYPAIKAALKL